MLGFEKEVRVVIWEMNEMNGGIVSLLGREPLQNCKMVVNTIRSTASNSCFLICHTVDEAPRDKHPLGEERS